MRRIDGLSPSEQARIATNVYVAMTDDARPQPQPASGSGMSVTINLRHLFIGYMILLLLVGAYFLITTPKAFTTDSAIWVPLIVVLGAALYCAVEFFWLMIASWFGGVLDRHLFDKI